jgi:hypothetical protein
MKMLIDQEEYYNVELDQVEATRVDKKYLENEYIWRLEQTTLLYFQMCGVGEIEGS